jgi:hypothetical protein
MSIFLNPKSARPAIFEFLRNRSRNELIALCRFLNDESTSERSYELRLSGTRPELIEELNKATRPDLLEAIDACIDDADENAGSKHQAGGDDRFPGPNGRGRWKSNPPPGKSEANDVSFRIYEIKLDRKCVEDSTVKKQNTVLLKSGSEPKGYLYVGYTAHSADYRFWQHTRPKSAKPPAGESKKKCEVVYRYGLSVGRVHELADCDRDEAEEAEQEHAEKRRRAGYIVYSGYIED